MDTVDPVRFVLAFVFVIGLIGLGAMLLKRYGNALLAGQAGGKWMKQKGAGGRLEVLEVRYIDARRKLVLVRCDASEHLLLLGDGRELVIESVAMRDER